MNIGCTNLLYSDPKRHSTKRLILVLLHAMIWLSLFGQETKLIEQKFPGSKQISERYYVLKSDNTIKHGAYTSYFKMSEKDWKLAKEGLIKLDDHIKIKTNYQNGEKHGEYLENNASLTLKTKGEYSADKKVGIWQTSRERGQVIERFDFVTGKKLSPLIHVTVNYPPHAQKNGVTGTVSISFKCSLDCTISDLKVVKSLSDDCDKEAIRAITRVRELQKKYGDACVDEVLTQVIHFKLE